MTTVRTTKDVVSVRVMDAQGRVRALVASRPPRAIVATVQGPQGPVGPAGPQGETGLGVPDPIGAEGQVIAVQSGVAAWADPVASILALTDVDEGPGFQDGDILVYDGAEDVWVPNSEAVFSPNVRTIVTLTQDDYDAIAVPDPNTMYVIYDEGS